jgi:Flp pilus assembly protein TadB
MIRKNIILVIELSAIILLIYACQTTSKQETKKQKIMENLIEDNRKMKPLETIKVELESRGSLGLQLLFKTDIDTVVKVNRIYPEINNGGDINPGDPIMVFFEISALKKGRVKITFYETQPWNKDFKEIIKKEMNIEVE